MKKAMFFSAAIIALFTLSCFISVPKQTGSENAVTTSATSAIPDDVKDVFKNSCMGCHATGGKGMAMAKLNFSEWDSYSAEKQAKKAEAICNVITKGSMPPKSFRQSHPEAIPTDAQKELICKWSKTCAEK